MTLPKLFLLFVQDLGSLNRDLSKVIMIDCDAKATSGYERNTIVLKKWEGDPSDTTLFDLTPLLLGKYCYLLLIAVFKVMTIPAYKTLNCRSSYCHVQCGRCTNGPRLLSQ